MPPITSTAHHYLLPIEGSRMVYRFADDGPQAVLDFWQKHGREWRVRWDDRLETPRLVYPLEPFKIAEPEPLGAKPGPEIIRSVEGFIDANAELFGVSSATLSEPYVYRLAGVWIFVFQQTTPGGILVRGANLRLVMKLDGSLCWCSCFTAHGVNDPKETLLSKEVVESAAASAGGAVESSTLQMGFATSSPESSMPMWSLWVKDDSGQRSEHIVDARLGTVLARRMVLKHFDGAGGGAFEAAGEVRGTCPDLHNVFLDPFSTGDTEQDKLKFTSQPLTGVLIVDRGFAPLVTTTRAGSFSLFVNSNPTTLRASLETGSFEPGGYAPILQIKPRTATFRPVDLFGQDLNTDGIPDQSQTRVSGESFAFNFYENAATDDGRTETTWWLQSYEHARTVLQFADGVLRNQLVKSDEEAREFLPLRKLMVLPMQGRIGIQDYEPHDNIDEFSIIHSSWSNRVKVGRIESIEDDVVPTFLQHEVAHHVTFHMTHCVNTYKESAQLEEGLEDVITAYTNDEPRIGYREVATGLREPTSLGFNLTGHDGSDFRSLGRVDTGEAFWSFREALLHKDPSVPQEAHLLLLAWLAAHRCAAVDSHTFDNTHDFFEELLLVDDLPGLFKRGDGDLSNGTPHTQQITDAFKGRIFFDAPFQRGDASSDGKLDISDAIVILGYLFLGSGTHDCKNALDVDDNSMIGIADPIYLLNFLFNGGPGIPNPAGKCGLGREGPGEPGNMGCRDSNCPF